MKDNQPIVSTTHGYVKGIERQTLYDASYYSFEHIPYARPPLGELRFRAPQPAEPWPDVLDCTQPNEKPLQKNPFTSAIEGAEDCLYLNVYVKKLQTAKPLPVLVYIYGGSFQNGGATRDLLGPDYFMQQDVVLVFMNYRLDALGFLRLEDPTLDVPGNAALKDQLAALRWLKQNCANFNGDPNNITLFGESAGAASAHYLMLSRKTQGLIHKAILMSGSVYNKWAHVPPGDYAYRLAKLNGYKGENVDRAVLQFLMDVDASKLVCRDLRTEAERFSDSSFLFAPTVEAYITNDCIIPSEPQELVSSSWSGDIPMMIGGTSFEGLLHYARAKPNPQLLEVFKAMPELLVPMDAIGAKSAKEVHKLGQDIIKLHMADAVLTFENVLKFLDIMSYKVFWVGFHRTALSRLRYAKAPTYLYRFDFDSPTFNFHRIKYCGKDIRGVAHADDLSYLFSCEAAWKLPQDSEEFKTIERMVGMWTAFARDSDPNCAAIEPTHWEPFNEAQPYNCLNISNDVKMQQMPEAEKLQYWHSLYSHK